MSLIPISPFRVAAMFGASLLLVVARQAQGAANDTFSMPAT
jgi:hypothetical protein